MLTNELLPFLIDEDRVKKACRPVKMLVEACAAKEGDQSIPCLDLQLSYNDVRLAPYWYFHYVHDAYTDTFIPLFRTTSVLQRRLLLSNSKHTTIVDPPIQMISALQPRHCTYLIGSITSFLF